MEKLKPLLAEAGIILSAAVCARLLVYLDELLRWNARINLTAITDRDEAVEKHLVDALTLLPLFAGNERLLDLGSGGGLPGIPLKIVQPGIDLLSVDAVAKKILFQRQVARLLQLSGFEAWHGRAEEIPKRRGGGGAFDVVVSRAFTSLEGFARLALPCLRPGGRLIAMKGLEGERELTEATVLLQGLGLTQAETLTLQLPRSRAVRTLIVLKKAE
jgi:16S rRNA (guanine527-N7)-methyltransferase